MSWAFANLLYFLFDNSRLSCNFGVHFEVALEWVEGNGIIRTSNVKFVTNST